MEKKKFSYIQLIREHLTQIGIYLSFFFNFSLLLQMKFLKIKFLIYRDVGEREK